MTELLVWLTLGVTAAIVVVLVVYLLGIIIALRGAAKNLEQLAGGLVSVRDSTAPLPDHVENLNAGLSSLLTGLLDVNGNLAAIVEVARNE